MEEKELYTIISALFFTNIFFIRFYFKQIIKVIESNKESIDILKDDVLELQYKTGIKKL